jgi:CRP-like cAMP-binding protein
MDNLFYAISQKSRIGEEFKSKLEQLVTEESFVDGDQILKPDQYCRKLYFLRSGMLRSHYYHDDKDVTTWFYAEGSFFTSWSSFYNQTPSPEYLEATEDCKVYSISFSDFQYLIKEFREFETFARLMAEEQVSFVDEFFRGYMFITAKEKYHLLLSVFPDIEQRAKLGHIASFIGISQETLSRIRS